MIATKSKKTFLFLLLVWVVKKYDMFIRILPIQSFEYERTAEISQQDNYNANAKLWLQSNNTVFKQYIIRNKTTCKNTRNVLRIAQNDSLYSIHEIAMPINIYGKGRRIHGYTMQYCTGMHIETLLCSKAIDPKIQLLSLINLANVINKLPLTICIGDLHGKNVLVEPNGEIHIIDVDGFSTEGCEITCPFSQKSTKKGIGQLKKYHHWNGKFKISRESDIFCFYMLVLSWLLKIDAFPLEKREIALYLQYLKQIGFPERIIIAIYNLYCNTGNSIDVDSLSEINLDAIEAYCYTSFMKSDLVSGSNKHMEEKHMSLRDRVNQLDKPETYEERAERVAENICSSIIRSIETKITSKQYEIVNGAKEISGYLYSDICYSYGNDLHFADSPHYWGGSSSSYNVNNEREAKYLVNAIVTRLEKEGCTCKVTVKSRTSSNGIGFWDSLFKGSTTRYTYSISYIFKWRN